MSAEKSTNPNNRRKIGPRLIGKVVGKISLSVILISALALFGTCTVLAQDAEKAYPGFAGGEWEVNLLLLPRFSEEKLRSIDFGLRSNFDLNFSLSENVTVRSRSWFDLTGLRKQQVISQVKLVEVNSTVSSKTVFDPNLHKEILTFTTHQVKSTELSGSLLLFFDQDTDSPEKLSYKQGIVIEGEWQSEKGIKVSSATGFGATADKGKVYTGLKFEEEVLEVIYPADWYQIKGSVNYGRQDYDRDDDGKEEQTFGIRKLTPEVELNLEKAKIKSNFTYGPNFEDTDDDGANEKVTNYAYKKATLYLSTHLGNLNFSHYIVLRPDYAWQRFRISAEIDSWIPRFETQFKQGKLTKMIFSLTSKL